MFSEKGYEKIYLAYTEPIHISLVESVHSFYWYYVHFLNWYMSSLNILFYLLKVSAHTTNFYGSNERVFVINSD